jgi:hypothetical protein
LMPKKTTETWSNPCLRRKLRISFPSFPLFPN